MARLYARFAFVDRAAAGAFSDEQVVEFKRWCRVCDNLIYNVRIDEIGGLISAIRGMDTLSDNCFDILAALPDIDVRQVSFFRNEQLNEEAEKATLIQEDPDWEPLLLETEHHPYLMGQVGFILELARTEDGKPDQIQFAEKAAKVKYLLTRDILGSREFLLQRALLSIGDYLVGGSFRNFSFCNPASGTFRDRSENWLQVVKKPVFSKLLDRIEGDVESSLRQAIEASAETDWKQVFVRFPKAISYCRNRWIHRDNSGIFC